MKRNISEIVNEIAEKAPHKLEDEKLTFLWVWLAENLELSTDQVQKFLECTNPSMVELLRKKKLEELGEAGKEARQKEAMNERIALNKGQVLVRF